VSDIITFSDTAKDELKLLVDKEPMVNPKFINMVFIRNTPTLEQEMLKAKISFNYIVGPDNVETITDNFRTNGSYHTGGETIKTNNTLEAINIAIVTYDIKSVSNQFIRLRELLRKLKESLKIEKLRMNQNIQFCNYRHRYITEEKKYWMFYDLRDPYIVDVTMRYLFTDRDLVLP